MERKIKKYVRCANGIGIISKGDIHRNMSCGLTKLEEMLKKIFIETCSLTLMKLIEIRSA
ncbi:MAG: hypothetical protein B1H08_01820 [Candidatus Omnitrophica bacterium 4484_171]|nr:MAG: hypothetical protein B1H08_01820 [Candidatus Omnitrophica bacterium 4484_171]